MIARSDLIALERNQQVFPFSVVLNLYVHIVKKMNMKLLVISTAAILLACVVYVSAFGPKNLAEKAGGKIGDAASNVDMPDVKAPDVNMPDINVPKPHIHLPKVPSLTDMMESEVWKSKC